MKEALKGAAAGASLGTTFAGLTTQAGVSTVVAGIGVGSSAVVAAVAVAPALIVAGTVAGLIICSQDD